MSTTNLPPWDPSTFVFDLQGNVPQCTNATWQYWGSDTSNPAPSPPYHGVLYAGGYQPYMIQFDNTAVTGATNWTANLPPGSSFGVSMFDSKNYTSGVLERKLLIMPQTNCTVSNPLKPSTLDVEVTGTRGQCEMAFVNIKNGTGPYKLEIVPLGHEQKTIYFESSPLGFVLDMSPGIEYWLAHYDSAGNSAVMGPYIITATADNRCLGVASTITAGRFSTLYPGGTTTSGATATATSATSNRLATPAIIGIAIAAPITAIAITALCLWFCYKRNRNRHGSEGKPEIEPAYNYHHTEYTPVPTTATHYSGSYHDVSVTGQYNAVVPVPYPLPPMSVSDRNTIYTAGEMSTSEPSSMGLSEKRRHLVNPDAHSLGPVDAEPFDPSLISGPSESRTQSGLPLLPPAYSPS
ncbi:hypothetical protein RSOLAG1IB_03610 [Rhizoctonia solani AG-1 IB]|uniref:Alphaherpesvirus glycoprotein E domain-containing protein n=1 Tax=Thanatephorus cucumeris (strain AG1-IB / isolate 7/3/14) TaxID=1108050 RepID=A0A0B7FU28_THACB|nr:hypothetical protein RSOLAG1IB_03610 [Rhizoctonia solani AG-1 IB]